MDYYALSFNIFLYYLFSQNSVLLLLLLFYNQEKNAFKLNKNKSIFFVDGSKLKVRGRWGPWIVDLEMQLFCKIACEMQPKQSFPEYPH